MPSPPISRCANFGDMGCSSSFHTHFASSSINSARIYNFTSPGSLNNLSGLAIGLLIHNSQMIKNKVNACTMSVDISLHPSPLQKQAIGRCIKRTRRPHWRISGAHNNHLGNQQKKNRHTRDYYCLRQAENTTHNYQNFKYLRHFQLYVH